MSRSSSSATASKSPTWRFGTTITCPGLYGILVEHHERGIRASQDPFLFFPVPDPTQHAARILRLVLVRLEVLHPPRAPEMPALLPALTLFLALTHRGS